MAPRDQAIADDVVVVSGSGGGAAIATDVLDRRHAAGGLQAATKERFDAVHAGFGSVTNPIDGTGAIYDDLALIAEIFDAMFAIPAGPTIAASVSARPVGNEDMHHLASTIADAARASERTFVAFQYSPLGGPLDPEVSGRCMPAGIPYLLGTSPMRCGR